MRLKQFILVCFSTVAISACQWLFDPDMTGEAIRFGASSGNAFLTRTEYSGKQSDGRELISWSGDDDVTIYMFWEGPNGDKGDAKDYNVINAYQADDKSICKGTLVPKNGSLLWQGDFNGNDGKAHEYQHTFYSVYPANSADIPENENLKEQKRFYFTLPDNLSGVDMRYAYMAAGMEGVTSGTEPVYLQYYPMITTLYVTLVNDTDKPVTPGNIVLTSTDKPLCGKYAVQFNGGTKKFAFQSASEPGKKTVTINVPEQLQPNKAGRTNIAFFIIPQEYDPSTLSFKINGVEHNFGVSYNSKLVGENKYNITVYLSGKEPEFSSFVKGVIYAEAHKRAQQTGQWEYGWYLDNDGDFAYNGQKVAEEKIWEIINSLVDLDVTGTWEMGNTLTPGDLNFFPNLKTVKVSGFFDYVEIDNPQITEIDIRTSNSGTCVFNIHDCDELEKLNIHEGKDVTVKGNKKLTELNIDSQNISDFVLDDCDALKTFDIKANNCIKNVTVKGNEILEYFTMSGPKSDGVNITCDSCPVLEWFSLTGGEGWGGGGSGFPWHKDIINCPKFDTRKVYVPGGKEY